ncbi:MAG: putative toxin-antitoxin system toxin component, PIN family [Rhodoferax sp.]
MAHVLHWVVDTNVLISAALSAQGNPAQLVRRLLQDHRLVFSQATFDELHTRLYRPKFDRYLTLELRQRLLHDFNASAHWVDLAPFPRYCRDPDDDKFIATALQAQANALVSGDSDLLDTPPIAGLRVLTPSQALEWLSGPGGASVA